MLAVVSALVGEVVPRGVHDRDVGAALRVREQRQDPLGGIRVGVVGGDARALLRDLALVGQEGHGVLAGHRVGACQHLVPGAGVQPHPSEVVRGVRHQRSVSVRLDPEDEVDHGGEVGGAQRCDDGVAGPGSRVHTAHPRAAGPGRRRTGTPHMATTMATHTMAHTMPIHTNAINTTG